MKTGATALSATVVALSLHTGCGSTITGAAGGTGGAGSGGEGSWIVETGSGGCNTVLYDPPDISGSHLEECSKIDWHTNPPTSGDHYGVWAAFKTYDETVPRGYTVHAQEHGAVVLSYNCPDGCEDEVTAMQELIDDLPVDPACSEVVKRRHILMPDPNLDVQFAASAWGHMLKADCFDADRVEAFIDEHYADGPEDLCGGGTDPLGAGGGGLPDGCGE